MEAMAGQGGYNIMFSNIYGNTPVNNRTVENESLKQLSEYSFDTTVSYFSTYQTQIGYIPQDNFVLTAYI